MEHTFSNSKFSPGFIYPPFSRHKVIQSSFARYRHPKSNKFMSPIGNFVKFPEAFHTKPATREAKIRGKLPSICSEKDRVARERERVRKSVFHHKIGMPEIEAKFQKTPRFGLFKY